MKARTLARRVPAVAEKDEELMEQPLRDRVGWPVPVDTGLGASADTTTMAAAGLLFAAAGAVLGVVSVLGPDAPGMDTAGILACSAVSGLMAVVAYVGGGRLPAWAFHAGCLAASGLATAVIWFWGEESQFGPLAYLLPTIYAFYLFSLRTALFQIGALGAFYAALLVLRDFDYDPTGAWLATAGTLLSAGLLVAIARDKVSSRIGTLADAARRDPLTRLLNRRGFEEAFDMELERARRTGQPLSLILGDLDRFKRINDLFGHGAGDEALHRVGASISHGKRSWDAAARIGGRSSPSSLRTPTSTARTSSPSASARQSRAPSSTPGRPRSRCRAAS